MAYVPDVGYPLDKLSQPNVWKLKFKRITFASLKAACCVGSTGVSIGNWTFVILQSYLKTEGLNTAITRVIYDSGLLQ